MKIKKAVLLVYLWLVKALFGFRIGSFSLFKNIHYYLVTNFFKAHPVKVRGRVMFVHLHDSILSPRLLRKGDFEESESDFMKARISKGGTVIDIGANIGVHTLMFSDAVGPEGKVLAFEPDPDNFALLKRNIAINGCKNVALIQKAVSGTSGFLRLFLAEENKGDHRIWGSNSGRRHIDIEAVTLDEYFKDYAGAIDFIKMDVQGAEGHVLKGARNILEKNTRLNGVMEFWPKGLKSAGTDPKEVLELLIKYGYKLYDIKSGVCLPSSVDELLAKYIPEADGQKEIFTNIYFCK